MRIKMYLSSFSLVIYTIFSIFIQLILWLFDYATFNKLKVEFCYESLIVTQNEIRFYTRNGKLRYSHGVV